MDIKLFKGFTAYRNAVEFDIGRNAEDVDRLMAEYVAVDPSPSSWRHIGFTPIEGNDVFLMDMAGAGHLCALAFNERNLPGAVIKEAVLEEAREIERRDGRKIGKKAFAELKEQVIAKLLPKAFIKRKVVPVMFIKDYILIFSTSAKVCDDAVSVLIGTFRKDTLHLQLVEHLVAQGDVSDRLTEIARDGQSDQAALQEEGIEDIPFLEIYNLAILKGEEKQTITVKDKDIGSTDIQDLLKQDYHVTKLGVKFWVPGETEAKTTFILNDKLVFSKFLMLEKVERNAGTDEAAVFNSVSWMTAKLALEALDCVISVMGGLRDVPRDQDDPGTPGAHSEGEDEPEEDDDDEI